jgi:predicted nucleotidyltransferase
MAEHIRQSTLRYPLTEILGSVACVRTLRELMRHGGELSAPTLVLRTGLAKRSVQTALATLESMEVIDALGFTRGRLFRARRAHPLAGALDRLFDAEEDRFNAVLEAVREAAGHCQGLLAVWIYGSVARGEDRARSDLDIAVVAEPAALSEVQETMRDRLIDAGSRLAFTPSVVAIDTKDVLRLAAANDPWWKDINRDAMTIVGDDPDRLLQRLTRARKPARRPA